MNSAKYEAWYSNEFAIVPLTALLDKRMGPRQLKVLIALAHHANRHGLKVFPSRERIAEMCGFYLKGKPHADLVSVLISNANHSVIDEETGEVKKTRTGKNKKTTGQGLVELGYVEKLGQRGENQTQAYRLMTPELSIEDKNQVTDRKLSKEEYKAKQQAKEASEAEAFFAKEITENEAEEQQKQAAQKNTLVSEVSDSKEDVESSAEQLSTKDICWHRGVSYHREEVNLASFDGDWQDIPKFVVEYFGHSYILA